MSSSLADLKNELVREMEDIKRKIESGKFDLNDDALDVLVETPLGKNEVVGFSILIAMGGPTIEWNYHRGVSRLVGYWGNVGYETDINQDATYNMVDYLQDYLKDLAV